MEGDHPRRELLKGENYAVKEPRISPNGRWMAYASSESGKFEVWVCPFPEVKKGWQVSAGGGNHPLWSWDGRELYYNNGNENATMAVSVETGQQFKWGTPTVLFRGTLGKVIGRTSISMLDFTYWDIDPTGKRLFLMLKDDPAEAPRKINIVLNWLEELKQPAPVK